ncbi:MAG: hypothetical protein ACRC1W_03000 [Shewanella sp.]
MIVKIEKLGMMLTGPFDWFEIELDPLESPKGGNSPLDAPCSIAITPESYLGALRSVLDGEIMFGHIPFAATGDIELIVSPRRLLAAMQKHEYEIILTDNFTRYLQEDSKPMTDQQWKDEVEKRFNAGPDIIY